MNQLRNIFWFLFLICFVSNAQEIDKQTEDSSKLKLIKIGTDVIDGDTLTVYLLKKIKLDKEAEPTEEEKKALYRLKRHIIKTMPYAKMAAYRIQLMEDNLSTMTSEREKKKYIKACEKAIKEQFTDDLKNLYVDEGKLLLKLIYRETGKSTYDIMQNYSGTLETLFWQSIAKSFNSDMRVTYDPIVDYQIEEIIKSLGLDDEIP